MLIKDKWVVFETRTKLYYAGNDKSGFPAPRPLSAETRQYKTRRAAMCAIDRISDITEYYSFRPEYIENKEVPESEIEAISAELAEVSDPSGWKEVYAFAVPGTENFSKIRLCMNNANGVEMFGVKKEDGKIYSAGFGGGEKALRVFCEYCFDFLLPRVTRQEMERIR